MIKWYARRIIHGTIFSIFSQKFNNALQTMFRFFCNVVDLISQFWQSFEIPFGVESIQTRPDFIRQSKLYSHYKPW